MNPEEMLVGKQDEIEVQLNRGKLKLKKVEETQFSVKNSAAKYFDESIRTAILDKLTQDLETAMETVNTLEKQLLSTKELLTNLQSYNNSIDSELPNSAENVSKNAGI